MNDEFEKQLRDACDGLLYISETDAEVTPFRRGAPQSGSPGAYAKALEAKPGEKVATVPFTEFFKRMSRKKDWFGKREIEHAEKWSHLKALMETNLSGLTVLRIGTVRIDIYIVGLDSKGELSGVKTKAVET